ncbi:Vacuolar protein sorting-associated protein 16 [Nymphon striatum]|nr:Vacuolar protein sorting-associated protein 16 [Nymphon striatum]
MAGGSLQDEVKATPDVLTAAGTLYDELMAGSITPESLQQSPLRRESFTSNRGIGALISIDLLKCELYAMEWQDRVDLNDFVVAAAPFGGPIALWRDEKKIQKVQWNSGRLKHIEWSSSEELLCVQDDGNILIYDIFANYQRLVSMGQEAKDLRILDCKIFHHNQRTGIAVLTSSYRVFVVNNINEPKIRRMAEIPGLETAPSSWGVVTIENQTSVFVAKEAELYLLDHSERCCQQVTPKFNAPVTAITEIAVSHNNRHLALFTDSGNLWLGTTELQGYCEYETESKKRPKQLLWCGTGAIVGYWDDLILIIGPEKDWLTYPFPYNLFN